MKKLIRVSTDLKVTIHDYPEGSYRTEPLLCLSLIHI